MLIRNYGLFWRREHVFWGKGNNAGHLRGFRAKAKKAGLVDFRDQQGLYCLYDDNFSLIYVGQTGSSKGRLLIRIKRHTRDALSDRWTKFSWFGLRAVTKQGALSAENKAAHPNLPNVLDHFEAILIAAAEPPLNRQGGRFGKGVFQYLQYHDVDRLN